MSKNKKFGDDPWSGGLDGFDSAFYEGGHHRHVKSCFETHPALPITADGKTYLIYGGSCSRPVVKDADVYIGFDHSMRFQASNYPWHDASHKVVEFEFPITDMCAPHNAHEFKNMITWVCNQLQQGKKIHAGCIGGHGRTGTFLAAVVAQLSGELDAITYVRKHYCKKAVESHTQVEFLHKHFGITKINGAKEFLSSSTSGKFGKSPAPWVPAVYEDKHVSKSTPKTFADASRSIAPVRSPRCIWGKN